MQKDGEKMLTGDKNENTLRQTELLKHKIPKIVQEKKSKKKRLHFAWNKLKFKKKNSFMSQNTGEIEILDFDEPTKFEIERNPKLNFRKLLLKTNLNLPLLLLAH